MNIKIILTQLQKYKTTHTKQLKFSGQRKRRVVGPVQGFEFRGREVDG